VCSTHAFTSRGFETSIFDTTARLPFVIISPATERAFTASISATMTAAPSCAKARQMARPMPFPPPVTTATLSFNRMPLLSSIWFLLELLLNHPIQDSVGQEFY